LLDLTDEALLPKRYLEGDGVIEVESCA